MSSDYHERNLGFNTWMRIDSISGQRSRAVSSPETSLGTFLKLSKKKVCKKSCGDLVVHRIYQFAKVNNEFHCIVVNVSIVKISAH